MQHCPSFVKLAPIMKSPRFISPILLALVLLFAQQAGVMHTLSHTLSEQEQQNKQLPHSPACGQCAAYTQMGSVLNSTAPSILLFSAPSTIAPDRKSVV